MRGICFNIDHLIDFIFLLQSYKQNKFNLLREESEGYSKLTVELTSSLGPPHSPQTGRTTEPLGVVEERARPVWEKVISLIGYFDLDPNRALDIILDVLSQHLTSHYSFFLALLSYSPWRGSYRRPLPETEAMDIKLENAAGPQKGKDLDEVLTLAEANSITSPAGTPCNGGGARVLAQVLGFKFSYYQVRYARPHFGSLTKCFPVSGSLRAHPAYSLPDCRHPHP